MAWIDAAPVTRQRNDPAAVTVGTIRPGRSSVLRLAVTLRGAALPELPWLRARATVAAAYGKGEHAGLLRLVGENGAPFVASPCFGRVPDRNVLQLRLSLPAGVVVEPRPMAACAWRIEGDALIVTLPAWATPSAPAPDRERPAFVGLDNNQLVGGPTYESGPADGPRLISSDPIVQVSAPDGDAGRRDAEHHAANRAALLQAVRQAVGVTRSEGGAVIRSPAAPPLVETHHDSTRRAAGRPSRQPDTRTTSASPSRRPSIDVGSILDTNREQARDLFAAGHNGRAVAEELGLPLHQVVNWAAEWRREQREAGE